MSSENIGKRKSILFITFSYPPETSAPANRLGYLSKYFANKGWDTTTVTQLPHYPQNKIYDGYENKDGLSKTDDEVNVFRVKPWIVNKDNFTLRVLSEIRFCWKAYFAMRREKYDFVYASCPYMFIAFTGYFISKKSKANFILEYRDITWKYFASSGKRTLGLANVMEKLMIWISKKAKMLVTTTEGQLKYFENNGANPRHKLVIPNGVSENLIEKFDSIKSDENEKKNSFTVTYGGLIGYAQGLKTVIDTAKKLPTMKFNLVGDGVERDFLMKYAKDNNINNVSFPGYVTLDELIIYYYKSDVLIAHLKDDPIFKITQPSKIWEYMITGKPVVYGGSGEAESAVKESNGGLVVPPGDSESMAEAIKKLKNDKKYASTLGEAGRKYVLNNLRRENFSENLRNYLINNF